MQMSNDQLVGEFYEAVMELHLARRQMAALSAENASLKARVAELEQGPDSCCSAPSGA